MSEAATQQTVEPTPEQQSYFNHNDKLVAPTGENERERIYRVRDIYWGAGGVIRVKLRCRDPRRNMYPSSNRLRTLVTSGSWGFECDSEGE